MFHLQSFLAPRGAVAQETSVLYQETVCLPLPWLLPMLQLHLMEVPRTSLWWLESVAG